MPPTLNQQKAADILIEKGMKGEKLIKGEILKEAGYSKTVQETPAVVFSSLGFREALAKYGLTEEKLASYLAWDLENKPKERLGEMKLAADLLGLLENKVNLSVTKSDESMSLIQSLIDGDGKAEPTS